MTLINSDKNKGNHVKFIEYTGKYPTLCVGVLTLEIDGERYKFGHEYTNSNSLKIDKNYEIFWDTGGSYGFADDDSEGYCNVDEWIIDINKLPEELRQYADEIDEVFNEYVVQGCCGGCIILN